VLSNRYAAFAQGVESLPKSYCLQLPHESASLHLLTTRVVSMFCVGWCYPQTGWPAALKLPAGLRTQNAGLAGDYPAAYSSQRLRRCRAQMEPVLTVSHVTLDGWTSGAGCTDGCKLALLHQLLHTQRLTSPGHLKHPADTAKFHNSSSSYRHPC
jgi:hypothetical protein